MFRNRSILFAILGLVFAIGVWLIPFLYPVDTSIDMLLEDHIVENWQFVFLFAAFACWLIAFIRARGNYQIGPWHTRRNLVYLGLTLLLFFGAGEEISWGQRIIGFKTPSFMSNNEQGEFNVHNLSEFDSRNAENPFSIRRLFLYFLVVWGTVIPLCALLSRRMRAWFQSFGMPIVPLAMGIQFVLYYAMTKVYAPLGIYDSEVYHGLLPQVRELQDALLLLFIAVDVMLAQRQPARVVDSVPASVPAQASAIQADAAR